MAYRAACSGMVRWKAVSKTATIGTPVPSASREARIAASAGPLWSGARSERASISDITPSSIEAGPENLSAPWTTRCPTASGPSDPTSRSEASQSSTRRTAVPWSGTAVARSRAGPFPDRKATDGLLSPDALHLALRHGYSWRRDSSIVGDVDELELERRASAVEGEHPQRRVRGSELAVLTPNRGRPAADDGHGDGDVFYLLGG